MATPAQLDTSHVRWHMPDELRGRLLGPNGLRLAQWMQDGSAVIVKNAPHRAVYRVRLPGLDCHVKHYRLFGWRSRVREMLRPTKARREYELGLALHARGVPTPQPLAWGVESPGLGPSASWLITATLDGTHSLLSFLDNDLPARTSLIRQRLARALGTLIARMHAAGVVHHDPHPGNLLLRIDAGDDPRLWLIDLHAISLGKSRSWPECRSNLVVFNRFFSLRASRTDRLRFWDAYRVALGQVIVEPQELVARELERRTVESNLQFWRARDRRCLVSNRYYRRIKTGGVRGFAVRDLSPNELASLLQDPDGTFERPDVRLLKDSRSSTVAEFDLFADGRPRRVVFKRFRLTDRRDPWLGLVRPTAALRSWVFGHGLRERCLPTPRPLAVFHRTRNGLPREGYLLVEKVEGATDLHAYLDQLAHLPVRERTAELRGRVTALARLLRQFHGRGLSHRDLKASNLLTASEFGDVRFWFIDLVGVRRHGRVSRARMRQNLVRLHASFHRHPLLTRTEKLRFLRGYLAWNLHGKDSWKEWWRAIDTATQAKVARNARRGRPLT
jgi:tRNA A-37 threonylcarbamoyl transferase component Bud32